jgi:hypothetical protein
MSQCTSATAGTRAVWRTLAQVQHCTTCSSAKHCPNALRKAFSQMTWANVGSTFWHKLGTNSLPQCYTKLFSAIGKGLLATLHANEKCNCGGVIEIFTGGGASWSIVPTPHSYVRVSGSFKDSLPGIDRMRQYFPDRYRAPSSLLPWAGLLLHCVTRTSLNLSLCSQADENQCGDRNWHSSGFGDRVLQ